MRASLSLPPFLLVLGLLTGCQRAQKVEAPPAPAPNRSIIRADYREAIAIALDKAGANREQLQAVLDYYTRFGDKRKLKAAEFLIANMPAHGFYEVALYDADGHEVPFNSLEYDNFEQAMAARERLEREHGPLRSKRKTNEPDVRYITADYLIENIDTAFEAWRNDPWAAAVTFDTFCQYMLPYRGSNEPSGHWRRPCRTALTDTLAKVQDVQDIQAISRLCNRQYRNWVRFDAKCYLYPTDQSFEQMQASGFGRCEDLSNMMIYLNRANGLPMSSDYTPAWARANNNHAWEVVLDADGQAFPRKKPMNGAAKVYRKMYAVQPDLPAFHTKPDETIPGWLRGRTYRDVTDEYRQVHDVTVQLTHPIPEQSSYAYLCVFNSGRWVAIAAGHIDAPNHTATFPNVGGNIVYYPAYCVDNQLIPAAPIHVLEMDGTVRLLDESITDHSPRIATDIRQTKDVDISPDTGKPIPAIKIEPGHEYELFYWDDQWISLGKKQSGDQSMRFDNLPADRLYRLKQTDGRDQERPFSLEDGRQVLW